MESIVTITTCYNPFLAELIKQQLADNGIASMIVDQTITGVNGGYGPMPGYAVRVYEKDEAAARAIAEEAMGTR